MLGLPPILSLFPNLSNNFNKTSAEMYDPQCMHRTLTAILFHMLVVNYLILIVNIFYPLFILNVVDI